VRCLQDDINVYRTDFSDRLRVVTFIGQDYSFHDAYVRAPHLLADCAEMIWRLSVAMLSSSCSLRSVLQAYIVSGTWFHVAVTLDPVTARACIYKNGASVGCTVPDELKHPTL
jgi:hypothetical protein